MLLHPGNGSVVALLTWHFLTAGDQRSQNFVGLVNLRDYGAPIVQKRAEREQSCGRTAQRLDGPQRVVAMAFSSQAGVLVNAYRVLETAFLRQVFHHRDDGRRFLPEAHPLRE